MTLWLQKCSLGAWLPDSLKVDFWIISVMNNKSEISFSRFQEWLLWVSTLQFQLFIFWSSQFLDLAILLVDMKSEKSPLHALFWSTKSGVHFDRGGALWIRKYKDLLLLCYDVPLSDYRSVGWAVLTFFCNSIFSLALYGIQKLSDIWLNSNVEHCKELKEHILLLIY